MTPDDYAALDLSPSQLLFEEVRARARDAIEEPGMVTYVRELRTEGAASGNEQPGDPVEYEIWLDWEANSARLDVRDFPDELVTAGITSSHFLARRVPIELPETPPKEELFEYFFDSPIDYLFDLERNDLESAVVSESTFDGERLIVVEAVRPGARLQDAELSDTRLRLVLSSEYLPLFYGTADVAGTGDRILAGSVVTSVLEATFLQRDSLEEGFFDERHVFGLDETPIERLQFATETSLRPYWLGQTFENLRLADVEGERDPNEFYDGHRFLRVDYSLDHVEDSGFPCDVRIFLPRDFDVDTSRWGVPRARAPQVLEEFEVAVGSVRIVKTFENVPIYSDLPVPSTPAGPEASLDERFAPIFPPVIDYREQSSISAQIQTDDVLVQVLLRCDRDDETTIRLLTSAVEQLRPFED